MTQTDTSKAIKQELTGHLDQIDWAKKQADVLTGINTDRVEEAELTMKLAWEAVFDSLCHSGPLEITELGTLSSVIQRLTNAYTQVKNVELKAREVGAKEKVLLSKVESALPVDPDKQGLRPESLASIEAELKLI